MKELTRISSRLSVLAQTEYSQYETEQVLQFTISWL